MEISLEKGRKAIMITNTPQYLFCCLISIKEDFKGLDEYFFST